MASAEKHVSFPDSESEDSSNESVAEQNVAKPSSRTPVAETKKEKPVLPPQTPASEMNFDDVNPLTPEVISHQATINIGTIGHVAHGKSTVVKAISGVQTVRFKNELVRNITIKLGYANAKIYQCDEKSCPRPGCFRAYGSEKEVTPKCERPGCTGTYRLIRHVSFVDCPGHDILMSTMLSGAAVMDAALLLVAGNETCPQPQTAEHLAALEIMQLKHIVILLNKVDLIASPAAEKAHGEIQKFIKGTIAAQAPIVPISAQMKLNIDYVLDRIVNTIPVPPRDLKQDPLMIIIRSFDVNKPGAEIDDLQGGVAGGSILHGVLRLGDEIEIRPGVVKKDDEGNVTCKPLYSRIVSLNSEGNALQYAIPGGLIGVGTMIDGTLCRGDRLVGQMLGLKGRLPDVYTEIEITFYLMRSLVGVRTTTSSKPMKVTKVAKNEVLLVNIGSSSTGAKVSAVKNDAAKLVLTTPACTMIGDKVALSRRVERHWRLIGWGTIVGGTKVELEER